MNKDEFLQNIAQAYDDRYWEGVHDIMKEINDKFLLHIWRKNDAELFFDEFFDWLRQKNVDLFKTYK